jgi:signal peptidase I
MARSIRGTRGNAPREPDDGARGLGGWLKELLIIVSVALLLSFLIKTFFFRAFFIPSGSMENTLKVDDRIFVNLLVPEPVSLERGDIVVFRDTQGWLPATVAGREPSPLQEALIFVGLLPDQSQQHLVKRVIGLGGDRVACCGRDGRITVNGEPLEEPYLYPGAAPSETRFEVTVPEGKIWVMGDHRNASADSRANRDTSGGFISLADVEGKAEVVAWPLDRLAVLDSHPEVFDGVPRRAGP